MCTGLLYGELARLSPPPEAAREPAQGQPSVTDTAPEPPKKKPCGLFSHYQRRQAAPSAPTSAPSPEQQLVKYLDKINQPDCDTDIETVWRMGEFKALTPLFEHVFCVVRQHQLRWNGFFPRVVSLWDHIVLACLTHYWKHLFSWNVTNTFELWSSECCDVTDVWLWCVVSVEVDFSFSILFSIFINAVS